MLIGPTRINTLAAGDSVKAAALDAVDEFARLAISGQKVIPAAGRLQVVRQAENTVGEWVAAMVVKEEPAVEFGGTKGGLD